MKFLALFLFLSVSTWAGMHSDWTKFQFEEGYLKIDTTKICSVDSVYINCMRGKGLSYYSTLDTNYAVIFRTDITKIEIYGMLSPTETYLHTLAQVFRYEFMKWQEWGVLDMTRDSAQHLIDRIMDESADIGATIVVYKKVCDEEPSQCIANYLAGGNSGGISSEDMELLPRNKILGEIPLQSTSVEEKSSSSELLPTSSFSGESSSSLGQESLGEPLSVRRASRFFWVYEAKLGTRYKVFDLNGNFLRDGIWEGTLKAFEKPVIVRFEDGKSVVAR